jgi:hypothetical protein
LNLVSTKIQARSFFVSHDTSTLCLFRTFI